MKRNVFHVELVGFCLALLYIISCVMFLYVIYIPGMEDFTLIYGFLFGLLTVAALAVVARREWGRKLVIVLNAVILIILAAHYLPKVDLIPFGYVVLSLIVLLYFTQPNVKRKFIPGAATAWSRSILMVDDDSTIIKSLRPLLMSHGYSVLTAGTGEDGLQIAKNQKPDLILLDVILPGIKGRDVCLQLKEDPETRGIPVVFMTVKDSPEDIQAEKDAGAVGHLTKPVDTKRLMGLVRDILDPKKKA